MLRAASQRRPAVLSPPPAAVVSRGTLTPWITVRWLSGPGFTIAPAVGSLMQLGHFYGTQRYIALSPRFAPVWGPAPQVLVPPPPPRFTPKRPIAATVVRLPAVAVAPTRPMVGKLPPATNAIVTVRPPTAVVVRLTPALAVLTRPHIGKASKAHRTAGHLLQPLQVRLSASVSGQPWPRPQLPWLYATHVPVFPFGPRFTIRDPGRSVELNAPNLTFSIVDPGLVVEL
jgi:hypothetical protein